MKTISTAWGRFNVFDNDLIGRALEQGEFWDEHLKPYLDEIIARTDPVVIEVGANIGFHTVYLANRGVRVCALEPLPQTFALLDQNISGNPLGSVVIAGCYAAYHEKTRMRIADRDQQLTQICSDFDSIPSVGSIAIVPDPDGDIESVVLDEYLANFDAWKYLDRVDMIKVDAQGCDLPALMGTERMIAEDKPIIIFEYEKSLAALHGHVWDDYASWLEKVQYTCELIGGVDFVGRPR